MSWRNQLILNPKRRLQTTSFQSLYLLVFRNCRHCVSAVWFVCTGFGYPFWCFGSPVELTWSECPPYYHINQSRLFRVAICKSLALKNKRSKNETERKFGAQITLRLRSKKSGIISKTSDDVCLSSSPKTMMKHSVFDQQSSWIGMLESLCQSRIWSALLPLAN